MSISAIGAFFGACPVLSGGPVRFARRVAAGLHVERVEGVRGVGRLAKVEGAWSPTAFDGAQPRAGRLVRSLGD